jgi:hypothetical protein
MSQWKRHYDSMFTTQGISVSLEGLRGVIACPLTNCRAWLGYWNPNDRC